MIKTAFIALLLLAAAGLNSVYSGQKTELLKKIDSPKISAKEKASLYENIGDIEFREGKYFDSLKSYASALDLSSSKKDKIRLLKKAANASFESGNIDGAIGYMRDADQIKSGDPLIKKKIAYYYEKADLYDAAINEYQSVKKLKSDEEALFALGNLYIRKGLFRKALDYFNQALTLEIKPEIYDRAALCYEKLGNVNLAEEYLKKAMSLEPSYSGYFQLGLLFFRSGKYAEAAEQFANSVNLKPDYEDAIVYGAISHFKNGDGTRAENMLKKAVNFNPNSVSAGFFMALINHYKGAHSVATAQMRKVIENIKDAQIQGYIKALTLNFSAAQRVINKKK